MSPYRNSTPKPPTPQFSQADYDAFIKRTKRRMRIADAVTLVWKAFLIIAIIIAIFAGIFLYARTRAPSEKRIREAVRTFGFEPGRIGPREWITSECRNADATKNGVAVRLRVCCDIGKGCNVRSR